MKREPTPRLFSRRELPSWLTPAGPDHDMLVFYGGPSEIREFVFTGGPEGVVFWEEWSHVRKATNRVDKAEHAIPEDVLIAAGVEAKRRRQ